MKRIDRLLSGAARFVFGLGVGFALTSAIVIVSNGSALDARDVEPLDLVELDPVIVTISPERFRTEQKEADVVPPRFHLFGSGAQKV